MKDRIFARGLCAGLCSVLCLGLTATAAAQEEFRWRFEPGQEFSVRLEDYQGMSYAAASDGIPGGTTRQRTIWEMNWRVESVDDAGTAVITHTFQRILHESNIALGEVPSDTLYDTQAEVDPAEPLSPSEEEARQCIEPLIGQDLTVTMSARGELVSLEFPGTCDEALEFAEAHFPIYAAHGIEGQLRRILFKFPTQAVAPGETWTEPIELPNVEDPVRFAFNYTGNEQHEDCELARLEWQVETGGYETEPHVLEDGTTIQGEEGDCRGSVLFDTEAGYLVEHTWEVSPNLLVTTPQGIESRSEGHVETTIRIGLQ